MVGRCCSPDAGCFRVGLRSTVIRPFGSLVQMLQLLHAMQQKLQQCWVSRLGVVPFEADSPSILMSPVLGQGLLNNRLLAHLLPKADATKEAELYLRASRGKSYRRTTLCVPCPRATAPSQSFSTQGSCSEERPAEFPLEI